MLLRSLFSAAAFLSLAATPVAMAQGGRTSESYQFIEAVKKKDSLKLQTMLNGDTFTSINTRDEDTGEGALHIVIKQGNLDYLSYLLFKKADKNLRDRAGNTPLMVAVTVDSSEAVQTLLAYKANVNLPNSLGETPLIRAVLQKNSDMVRTLLAAGADPDKKDYAAGRSARDYSTRDSTMPSTIVKMLADAPKKRSAPVSGPTL